MNSRICPTEEILSEYMNGLLEDGLKRSVEQHLASCDKCRKLLAETHEILSQPDIFELKESIFRWIRKNRWLLGTIITFACSFIFSKYFLQFLVACLLMGAKWIIEARTTKMLVMIHEAWKSGDQDKTNRLLSHFESKKLTKKN